MLKQVGRDLLAVTCERIVPLDRPGVKYAQSVSADDDRAARVGLDDDEADPGVRGQAWDEIRIQLSQTFEGEPLGMTR